MASVVACFHPLSGYQEYPGARVRIVSEDRDVRYRYEFAGRSLQIPCGRCIGCRLVRQRAWAIRCMHEAQLHSVNSFVTLTYDDAHYSPSLNYFDFQVFMKKLRLALGPTRFFMCGEYGDLNLRPHFHAILFGRWFTANSRIGAELYRSSVLEKLWPHGFSSFGHVTHQSAAYVASYTKAKRSGPLAKSHYTRVDYRTGEFVSVVPEFGRMSLKPGIGYFWFLKHWTDVYVARDGVVRPGGALCPSPRFYDSLLLALDSDLREEKDFDRYVRSSRFVDDCSPARLLSREKCALAKSNFTRKSL